MNVLAAGRASSKILPNTSIFHYRRVSFVMLAMRWATFDSVREIALMVAHRTINATSAKRPARSGLPPKPALAAVAARFEGRGRAATSRAPADPASSCAGAGRTVKEQAEGAGPGPGERDPARVWPSGEATRSRPGRGQAPPRLLIFTLSV